MNVKIKETGEVKLLSITDPKSGVNWVADLVGNAGAFLDGQFVWSDEDDAYLATEDTYNWWAEYISNLELTNREVLALADELDIDPSDILDRIEEEIFNDYEDHRRIAVRVMREIREWGWEGVE